MFVHTALIAAALASASTPINAVISGLDPAGGDEDSPLLALAHDIEGDLRALRDQPETRPLAIEVITPDELARRASAGQTGGAGALDLFRIAMGATASPTQVAGPSGLLLGLYDPASRRMTIIDRPGMSLESQKLRETLAHELSHALDDELYDLQAFQARAVSLDQAVALHAVIEGSATWSAELYMRGWRDEAAATNRRVHRARRREARYWDRQVQQLDAAPFDAGFAAFPYVHGVSFLVAGAEETDAGLRATMAHVVAHPPDSTEQILHPDLYWQDRDRPDATPTPLIDRTIRATGDDVLGVTTMGELAISLALQGEQFEMENLDSWTDPGSTGWGGDTFVFLGDTGAGRWYGRAVWFTTWDSATDRDEFITSLTAMWKGVPVPVSYTALDDHTVVVTFAMLEPEVNALRTVMREPAEPTLALDDAR